MPNYLKNNLTYISGDRIRYETNPKLGWGFHSPESLITESVEDACRIMVPVDLSGERRFILSVDAEICGVDASEEICGDISPRRGRQYSHLKC